MSVINEIRKAFNHSAPHYESAAKVQSEIGYRLFERLDYLNIQPQRILDLGCGTGLFSKELAQKYPKAHIVSLDVSEGMLQQARKKQTWRRKWSFLAADMMHLPFETATFDLVFANQVIHWADSVPGLFRELNRVLKPQGCFFFSTLGPDTFMEIKQAWSGIHVHSHVNEFLDMHHVGDAMLQERFMDPVMDMEFLYVHYKDFSSLINALKKQGVKNIHSARNPGLTGKTAWMQFKNQFASGVTKTGKYPLTYEVVYGHAWKGETRNTPKGIETLIAPSSIVTLKASG